MNKLDQISYYLSYTDIIPVVNLISGVAHLICAIRDQVWGAPNYKDPKDFLLLTEKKLDNWTHAAKAAAIFSIVGTLLLMVKTIDRKFKLDYVEGSLDEFNCIYSRDKIPDELFNHRDWLEAAFRRRSGIYFSDLFKKAVKLNKIDQKFALYLIEQNLLRSSCDFMKLPKVIKENRSIAVSFSKNVTDLDQKWYGELPEHLRNDLVIAKQLASHFSIYDITFVNYITDKEMLKKDITLCRAGLLCGKLKFKELDPNQQENPDYAIDYAIAAIQFDHRQWADFPIKTQNYRMLLEFIRDEFNNKSSPRSTKWRNKIIADANWFKNYWASHPNFGDYSFLRLSADNVKLYFPACPHKNLHTKVKGAPDVIILKDESKSNSNS